MTRKGGMFCAYGEDRTAFQELAALMTGVIADGARMRGLITSAEASRFGFDD